MFSGIIVETYGSIQPLVGRCSKYETLVAKQVRRSTRKAEISGSELVKLTTA